MPFTKEADFEEALIRILSEKGWEREVLRNYTEEQLIKNWADILFANNRGIDRLNDYPLTDGEMGQILEQVRSLKTPMKLNGFINGKEVSIIRDHPEDKAHFGKEVSLKIYDRREIAAGQSRYQIAQQPKFPTRSKILNDRRGDLMLLINGMPVIHIELKKSGVSVQRACSQIEKYAGEGIFTGLFSLVQIFVAMNPEETLYFANPGPEGTFNPDFYFHWADFNNEPVNDWKQIAATLLSIPMAHQLIGFYTVADGSDGVLKVMRSYQYFAANRISDKVADTKWESGKQRGGFIWHTTGSGKTMTSFKSAQLIAGSKDADKVVFLMDRIELGTQSLSEYRNFANDDESVQATENTEVLIGKLKSDDPKNTLIVTSIQKMSNIKEDAKGKLKAEDLAKINGKRIVFILDECHRSTFGDMLLTIKTTFPRAIFFGFTGTPIQEENQKKKSTTAIVFGDELHRYSIADGIRDKNVLGFDPYKVLTYKDDDVKQAVALEKAKAQSVEEVLADPKKEKVYYDVMALPMAGRRDAAGNYHKGIEDYLPNAQYQCDEHRRLVVQDILDHWAFLSRGGKFHAILATASIREALAYYRLMKSMAGELKVTALFDPGIDNNEGARVKEEALAEIVTDYNVRYGQDFTIPRFAAMKKDISARLSHKRPYERIDRTPELQIDVLIVVDQMLTGFDSKWVNTLYLDKMLQYENIIQAFSRTNRLFGPEKPFGTIKYYRRPHTMEQNVRDAVKLYSGDKPLGLFVQRLDKNLLEMNEIYRQIKDLFARADVKDFTRLPDEPAAKKKFADLFRSFQQVLDAAKVQGFTWEKDTYEMVKTEMDAQTYQILVMRYKELSTPPPDRPDGGELPYDIDSYLISIETETINTEYMNSRFTKYLKLLRQNEEDYEMVTQAADELHKTFATLTQEEQKYANLFLHDVESGDVIPEENMTFRDYITEYLAKAKDDQIHRLSVVLGLAEDKLRDMMGSHITEANINEFGRFDDLKSTADKQKARDYFEAVEGSKLIPPKVPVKIDKLLRAFILSGGYDIPTPEDKRR